LVLVRSLKMKAANTEVKHWHQTVPYSLRCKKDITETTRLNAKWVTAMKVGFLN